MKKSQSSELTTWSWIIHVSVFAGYLVPLAGLITPIVIWMIKKDDLPGLRPHANEVFNFLISMFIYGIVAGLLCLIVIGIPLLFILGIVAIVFPIIGAVKAASGEYWQYPMMIRFFG